MALGNKSGTTYTAERAVIDLTKNSRLFMLFIIHLLDSLKYFTKLLALLSSFSDLFILFIRLALTCFSLGIVAWHVKQSILTAV